jgi:uncharacterized protein (DUF433 family)
MAEVFDKITVNLSQCGGKPCIRGMRIRVSDVLDLLASGLSSAEVLEELPDLVQEDIDAVLRVREPEAEPPDRRRVKLWLDTHLSPALCRWLSER